MPVPASNYSDINFILLARVELAILNRDERHAAIEGLSYAAIEALSPTSFSAWNSASRACKVVGVRLS
jgi:hypothetical protein